MSKPPLVKVQNGATYTIVERLPASEPSVYYWLGDDGVELEVTSDEIHLYGLHSNDK